MADEIERLRRKAAELAERAARRNTPLSPGEDAEISGLSLDWAPPFAESFA